MPSPVQPGHNPLDVRALTRTSPDNLLTANDTESEESTMTPTDFINYAKSFGYDIQFTGIGMAYITLGDIKLTETMDTHLANNALAQIGMAIMVDTLRTENW